MSRKLMLFVICLVAMLALPFVSYGADKLIVQDGSSNTKFVVTDGGYVGVGAGSPGTFVDVVGDNVGTTFRLTRYGGNPGANFRAAQGTAASPSQVLADGLLGGFTAAGYTSGGAFSSNMVGIYFRAAQNFTASAQGTYLGIETTPVGSTTKAVKALFNDGGLDLYGVVTTHSSRASKDNIQTLAADKALNALRNLEPVTFTYKFDKAQPHVGFIAEDVPELVATKDRRGVSEMDIVGVLTRVVKEQDKTIEKLLDTVSRLEAKLNKLESKEMSAQK